jgi:hypothetical protein
MRGLYCLEPDFLYDLAACGLGGVQAVYEVSAIRIADMGKNWAGENPHTISATCSVTTICTSDIMMIRFRYEPEGADNGFGAENSCSH